MRRDPFRRKIGIFQLPSPLLPFSLTSLTLLEREQEECSVRSLFLAAGTNSITTLQDLELHSSLFAVAEIRDLLSSLLVLESLSINVDMAMDFNHLEQISLSLAVCATPSLVFSGSDFPLQLFGAPFHPSLESLEVTQYSKSAEEIIRWVYHATRFPFQELVVNYARGVQDRRELVLMWTLGERKGSWFGWKGNILEEVEDL